MSPVSADEQSLLGADEQTVREKAETADFAGKELKHWEFALDDERGTLLQVTPKPVTRWAYFDSGRYYGNVFVVSANGRPKAIFSLFRWYLPTQGSYFTGTSLSDVPFTANRDGKPLWMPRKSNASMQLFENAPPPQRTAGARLVQMRGLARQFKAEVSDQLWSDQDTVKQLRLLPQPVFRYGTKSSDLIDGAIFALANGATPALYLVIEADKADGKTRWRYGIARQWTFKARASLSGEVIWSVQEVTPWENPRASMFLDKLPE